MPPVSESSPSTPRGGPEPSPLLDSGVPLSQSVIWQWQQRFYVQRALKAWAEDRVPNFITNNPLFAEIYARIVFAFLEDCHAAGVSPGRPLHVIELGAGPGKFCYLFLRHLTKLLRDKGLGLDSVSYCMTDCVPALQEQWRANSCLQEFIQAGTLEFELLDLSTSIHPEFLNRAKGGAPLVVIANYVYDSLPQDAFVVRDGQIYESLVSTKTPQEAGAAQELSRLEFSYTNVPVPAGRYAEPSWNQILNSYKERLPGTTVLFPSAALGVFQRLNQLSDGPMLLLAADKGYVFEDALRLSQGPPVFEFHAPNCFSLMVNFDAMARYFCALGGEALLPDKHFSNLNICGFLNSRSAAFPRTRNAYREMQSAIGADDLFTLLAWLNAHMEEMSVQQILATLRLSRWDPIAFMRLFPILARQLQTVSLERSDLHTAVIRTWTNHYPISANENELAFQCGVVLLHLRFYKDAVEMFQISQTVLGPSAPTAYNLGLCFLGLERSSEALAHMREACRLDSKFEPAQRSREKLEQQANLN
jgi:tetratricopeptide (TPR) repeat protein